MKSLTVHFQICVLIVAMMGSWTHAKNIQWDIKDGERGVGIVSHWPNIPSNFLIPDYLGLAKKYEELAFLRNDDLTHRWRPGRTPYFDSLSILQPSFLLHNAWAANPNVSESLVVFPGILSSALIGTDTTKMNVEMDSQDGSGLVNLVRMMKAYYHYDTVKNPDGSENGIFTDHFAGNVIPGGSFWYQLVPNVYAMQIQSLYSVSDIEREKKLNEPTLDDLTRRSADTLVRMTEFLKNGKELPSFDYSGVKIAQGKFEAQVPKVESRYEPDAAGSVAYIGLLAFERWKEPKYLKMADDSLRFLENYYRNPVYELQLNYGIVAAARMNRQHSKNYNIKKLMQWAFSRSDVAFPGFPDFSTNARPDVGLLGEQWGKYPVYGLWGGKGPFNFGQPSCSSCSGYAFYMNTISQATTLAPIAKYYPEYATLFGKYLLHVASNSKVFFHDHVSKRDQHSLSLKRTQELVRDSNYSGYLSIPYEGFRKEPRSTGGFRGVARGDAVDYRDSSGKYKPWAETNQSLYSGALTGVFASILKKTNIPEVPLWDLNKTDFQGPKSFPTYLVYNPKSEPILLTRDQIPNADQSVLWDMVSHRWVVSRDVTIPSQSALVLVLVPYGSVCSAPQKGAKGIVCSKQGMGDNIRIDYEYQ